MPYIDWVHVVLMITCLFLAGMNAVLWMENKRYQVEIQGLEIQIGNMTWRLKTAEGEVVILRMKLVGLLPWKEKESS